MSAKLNLGLDELVKDDKPKPTLLQSRKEAADVRQTEQDEMITLLREIAAAVKSPAENKTRSIIQACIAIILCVIAISTILVSVSGDKRELEVMVKTVTQRNTELWQLIETQRLRIDQINTDNAVRDALDKQKAGKR